MFVINVVAVISNLFVVTINKLNGSIIGLKGNGIIRRTQNEDILTFKAQFFRVPLNILVCTPGGTRTPGCDSLL